TRTAVAHPLPEPGRGRRLGPGHRARLPPGARRLLARWVRLAGPRAPSQPARPLRDRDRGAAHPFRARALAGAFGPPADPEPRMAGPDRRVARRDRPGHRPGGAPT